MPKKYNGKNGWKDIQLKKAKSKKTKLALIALAMVVGLLLLSQAVRFTKMLFSPHPLSSDKRTHLWNGEFNINVLLHGKNTSLLIFIPQNQTITLIDIPDNLYLEVSDLGKWQMGSIYDLGESQKNLGGKLLKTAASNLFGLPIDGFLHFFGKYSQKSDDLLSEIRKNPLILFTVSPYLKTDLTPIELIRLKIGLSGVRFDKVRHINLQDLNLLEEDYLADGTAVYTSDFVKLDSIMSDNKDPLIQAEHKTVAIFNSTDHPGLAQKAARLITNTGGEVIITSNGQKRLEKTQIAGEKSKTLDYLKQLFEAGDIIDPSNEDLVSSRAQINIFLGEDYYER